MKAKEYWLYLEPYTFINYNSNLVFIYNTVSCESFTIPLSPLLFGIVKEISDYKNMYCVSIDEFARKDKSVDAFLNMIRNSFSGDIIPVVKSQDKPIVMPPICNIQNDVTKGLRSNFNIMKYLHEIHINITGECFFNCQHCSDFYSQIGYCKNNSSILSFDSVILLLSQLNFALNKVIFFGGDIFNCGYFEKLIDYLHFNKYNVLFELCCDNILNNIDKLDLINGFTLNILLNSAVRNDDLCRLEYYSKLSNVDINFIYPVFSESDYNCALDFINDGKVLKIIPIYTGDNIDFFEKYVYLEEDDLKSIHLSKNNIFINNNINLNNFGKLYCTANGEIYSNLNRNLIGTIKDSLVSLVKKEFELKESWFTVRKDCKPCSGCIYNFLCASPSNYELVIGKYNLCHVKNYK